MKSSLSFFRVFDIAFFAPGLVLVWALGKTFGFPQSRGLTTAGGAVDLVFFLGFVYVLGLAAHAVARIVKFIVKVLSAVEVKAVPWYARPGVCPSDELSIPLYFWYLRATCWNLAVALAFSAIVLCGWGPDGSGKLALALAILGALLFLLGMDFHRSFRCVMEESPAEDRNGGGEGS